MTRASSNPVRMIDIAREAGVSKVTVAKALHGTGGNTRVSQETAERVRRIAIRMDYHPNLAARQLRGQKSHLIGAIIDSQAPESVIKQIAVLERVSADHGYRFIVGYSHGELNRISEYVKDFVGRAVDGVICLSHTYPEYGHRVADLFRSFEHCVFVEAPLSNTPIPFVAPDYEEAGYLIARHLVSLGRKRIAIIQEGTKNMSVQAEFKGYRRALREGGAACEDSLVWRTTGTIPFTLEGFDRCISELLPARPDAVVTPNDGSAIWAIRALGGRGIRVPDDCAVVSTDRWDIGQAWMPSITSVDLRFVEVTRKAIDMLFTHIEDAEGADCLNQSVIVAPRLVVAQSCGASL